MIDKSSRAYLEQVFSDVIDYGSDDPLQSVDPISYVSPEGDSCLHIAAGRGDLRAVGILIGAGLDVNKLGDMGNTPLHYAKKGGHNDVVALLIESGALLDIKNEFGENS